MKRRRWISIAFVASIGATLLLRRAEDAGRRAVPAVEPGGAQARSVREEARSEASPPDAPSERSSQAPDAEQDEFREPWHPAPLHVRGWGTFLCDIVGARHAVKPPLGPKIRLVQSKAPHFAVRFRPDEGTLYNPSMEREWLSRLTVELVPSTPGLELARSGPTTRERLAGAEVFVVPFEITGWEDWRGHETQGKIVVREHEQGEWRHGQVIVRDVEIQKHVVSPYFGHLAANDDEEAPPPAYADCGRLGVTLLRVDGVAEARCSLRRGSEDLPVEILRTEVWSNGKFEPVPYRQFIEEAELVFLVRIHAGWYVEPADYELRFTITDCRGEAHALQWKTHVD